MAPQGLSAYIWSMAKGPIFRKQEADKSAYQAEQARIHNNMLRLRAERLAREASAPKEPLAEPVKRTKARKKVIHTGG